MPFKINPFTGKFDQVLDSTLSAPVSHTHDKIEEGDSYVIVNDTGTGGVSIVVDGVIVSQTVSSYFHILQAAFYVGVNDSVRGICNLYGDSGGNGGNVRLFNGATADATESYYSIRPTTGGELLIEGATTGKNVFWSDPSAQTYLYYNGVNAFYTSAVGFGTTLGTIYAGQNDTTRGVLNLYGDSANAGGLLRFYSGATSDTDVNHYYIQNSSGALGIYNSPSNHALFYASGSSVALYYNDAQVFETTANGIDITGLQIGSGQLVTELSTDGTLAGNSNTAVPTEQAVKTYVDRLEAAIISSSNATAWDTDNAQCAVHTMTENTTISAPTNLNAGGIYMLRVVQAAGVYTLSWNAVFKWGAATTPAAPAASGDVCIFRFYSDGTNMYGVEDVREEA